MPHTSRCSVSTAWNPLASVIGRTVIAAIATHSTTTPRDVARKILRRPAGKSRIGVACFVSNEAIASGCKRCMRVHQRAELHLGARSRARQRKGGELSGEEEGQEKEVAPTEQMLERGDGDQSRRRVFFFARPGFSASCPAVVRYICSRRSCRRSLNPTRGWGAGWKSGSAGGRPARPSRT